MIVQDIFIPSARWHVRLYVAVTKYLAGDIVEDIIEVGCRGEDLKSARSSLWRGALDTGLTYSDYATRQTVMVIQKTSTAAEFLDTFVHETQHLCQHIALATGIDIYGERICYIGGDFIRAAFPKVKHLLCDGCRKYSV